MSDYCRRCGKPLKSSKSVALGIGPECLRHIEEETRRPLFDMGKGKRNTKRRQLAKQNFNKEEKEVIHDVIDKTVNRYTAAMLYALRIELNFGPKRAQRFAGRVQEIFEDVTAGRISLNDIRQVVLDELGIEIT